MIAWLAYIFHWPPSEFKKMTLSEFMWWGERADFIAHELVRLRGGGRS